MSLYLVLGMNECTYHKWNSLLVGNLGDSLEIRNVVTRVSNGLEVNGLGAVIDGGRDILCLVSLDELGRDSQTRQENLELVVSATVQVAGRDDVVASVSQGSKGHELRGLAGGGGHSGNTALESSNSLLEDIDGGLGYHNQSGRSLCPDVGPLTFMIRL